MNKQQLISKFQEYEATLRDLVIQIEIIVKEARKRSISSMGQMLANDLIGDINKERSENRRNIMRIEHFSDDEVPAIAEHLLKRMEERLHTFRERVRLLPRRMI